MTLYTKNSDLVALRRVHDARNDIASLCTTLMASASANDRQRNFDALCDCYDSYTEQTANADAWEDEGFGSRARDLERKHRDAIDDLLFQMTCTPVKGAAFDRLLRSVRDALFGCLDHRARTLRLRARWSGARTEAKRRIGLGHRLHSARPPQFLNERSSS